MKTILPQIALFLLVAASATADEPAFTPLNLTGKYVALQGFNPAYFTSANPALSPADHVKIIDFQAAILRDAHNYNGPVTFIYDDDQHCGASSDSRTRKIRMCRSFLPENMEYGTFPWSVTAHEMSHLMGGASSAYALFLYEHGYSAYLDEHQAEVMPEYVFRKIKQQASSVYLTPERLKGLEESNKLNRTIQERAYRKYVEDGKPFKIHQSDVALATQTGQATSHMIFALTDIHGVEPIKKFVRLLKDTPLSMAGMRLDPRTVPNEIQVANYVVAAWSLAFGKDLRATFAQELGYPVDGGLFKTYCFALDRMSSVCPGQYAPSRVPAGGRTR